MSNIENLTETAAARSPSSIVGCTIALPARLPQALVLANSFRKFYPQSEFAILLLDKPGDPESVGPGVRRLYLSDLALESGEEWRLPMLYDAGELIEVLKPALLYSLLISGARIAAYFKDTTEVFSSLPNLLSRGDFSGGLIATEATPADSANRASSFIAAAAGAEDSLSAWFRNLQSAPPNDGPSRPQEFLATLESAFASVSHQVIAEPGFGVGYWNLEPKNFAWTGQRYEVEGNPLQTFEFRGYAPDKPHLLSKHQGLEPRILLSEWPVLAKLCDEYREKVMRAGFEKHKCRPYCFDYLPGGVRIDHRMVGLYRQALRKWKEGLDKEPPSPLGPEGEPGFLKWLNAPLGESQPLVTRYMLAVYDEREDVKKAFPDPIRADAGGFRDWYLVFGQRELDLPEAVVPFDSRSKVDPNGGGAVDPGRTLPVNVAGYFRAELGIGAAARSVVLALEVAEIPVNTVLFRGTSSRQSHPFVDHTTVGPADINIVCVNADQIAAFAEKTGPELLKGRYTIGLWFWEAEDFPEELHQGFNYVDEVWVASAFMRETFLKVSPKPVFKFKLPVLKPEIDPVLSKSNFGLPDRFVFLFCFDFFSVLERKNPLGLIEAFTRAFGPGEGPVLVIKTINGDKRVIEMEKLRYAVRGRPDVMVRDGYLSPVQNSTLTALADCYVSLHRSEGFGLTIAEAMALGKPAIATAYSGNLEFMTEANSYLCPWRRSEVGPDREPYPAASHWAEPDLEAAAELLRHVFLNQEEARQKGMRAAEEIVTLHSPRIAGPIIRQRLEKIRWRRSTTHPVRSVAFLEDRLEELEGRGVVTTSARHSTEAGSGL